jgi:addiction module RelB/DinJ family antitoxin
MATKSITIRVDEDVKKQAESILDDIGINVTTLFNACLKAVIREKRVPFSLVSNEYELKEVIKEKLGESLIAAADSNAQCYSHEEIFAPLREKYGYKIQE